MWIKIGQFEIIPESIWIKNRDYVSNAFQKRFEEQHKVIIFCAEENLNVFSGTRSKPSLPPKVRRVQ